MQHLNLYSQLDRDVAPLFSARQQLQLLAVVCVLMIATSIGLSVSKNTSEIELSQLVAEQKAVEAELAVLKAEKKRLEQHSVLDNEIAGLQHEVKFRRRLLASIDPDKTFLKKGFADHLSGLARQHIDGMWFTDIQLQQGGQQLALMGRTRAPEYVPQFLQKLSSEEIFSGHQFRVLRMNVPAERKDLLDFELRANEVGLP